MDLADDDDDLTVCCECVEHDGVAEWIRANATHESCSYCDTSGSPPRAVTVDDLVEHMERCIFREYEDAGAAGVPYESREGGYQFPTRDTLELLDDLGFYAGNDELHDLIARQLPANAWVEGSPFSLNDSDELLYGWGAFSELVKYHARYLLFPPRGSDANPLYTDGTPPEDMLVTIADLVRELDLTVTLPEDTPVYRVRVHQPHESPETFAELGPPPSDRAEFSNRMSPSGISLFYGALDVETALEETIVDERRPAVRSVARFLATRPIVLLDLSALPEVPDFFADSDDSPWLRHRLIFLHDFAEDLARPVPKERREHIEYIPSQVVTEFFRHRYRHYDDQPIDGILYTSSRRPPGQSVVLFFSHDDVTETWRFGHPRELFVRLDPDATRREPLGE